MDKEAMIENWKKFTEGKDFMLNPDEKFLDALVKGELMNKEKYGLTLCPCRLRDGTKETDLGLLCPCNFFTQDVWKEQGRCWCGLFVKRT
ncbi:MAG: ferredoxin-thioredoxin reductase catalytic domain-containing protein [archaeon]